MYGSHTLIKICSYLTQFLKENHQNSTWKSLHVSHKSNCHGVKRCSQICHKHIHIMGWKDRLLGKLQTSKQNSNLWATWSLFNCPQQLLWVSQKNHQNSTWKSLLGCWGHFLYILFHCNTTAHSLMCMIHMQIQRTAWNMAFDMKQIVGEITV